MVLEGSFMEVHLRWWKNVCDSQNLTTICCDCHASRLHGKDELLRPKSSAIEENDECWQCWFDCVETGGTGMDSDGL